MPPSRLRFQVFAPLDSPVQQLVSERLASAWLWHGDSLGYAASFQRFALSDPMGTTLRIESPGILWRVGGFTGAAPIDAIHLSRSPTQAPTGPGDARITGFAISPEGLQSLLDDAQLGPHDDIAGAISTALFDGQAQSFRGGAESDVAAGGRLGDRIRTGEGDDIVQGSAGADRIRMGRGEDDVLTYAGFDGPALRYADGVARLGGDRQTVRGAETVVATARDDRMTGGARDDRFFGGPGDDRIKGGGGSDSLHGEDDADQLRGGRGADALFGGAGDDVLFGGLGPDRLHGGGSAEDAALSGDDRLSSGPGDDLLQGGSAASRLV